MNKVWAKWARKFNKKPVTVVSILNALYSPKDIEKIIETTKGCGIWEAFLESDRNPVASGSTPPQQAPEPSAGEGDSKDRGSGSKPNEAATPSV